MWLKIMLNKHNHSVDVRWLLTLFFQSSSAIRKVCSSILSTLCHTGGCDTANYVPNNLGPQPKLTHTLRCRLMRPFRLQNEAWRDSVREDQEWQMVGWMFHGGYDDSRCPKADICPVVSSPCCHQTAGEAPRSPWKKSAGMNKIFRQ